MGALADTDDVFYFSGTKPIAGYTFKDFLVCPAAGVNTTPVGRDCFDIDGASNNAFFVGSSVWDHLFIDRMKTGYSIHSHATTSSTSGGFAYSTIRDCELQMAWFQNVGDNILLDHNIIGFNTPSTSGPDVYWYNIPGAANFCVTHNVISGGLGFVVSAAVPIAIENAIGAIIENNRISKPSDAAKPIVISSAAVNTTIGVNKYYVGGSWVTTGFISDAGTNTGGYSVLSSGNYYYTKWPDGTMTCSVTVPSRSVPYTTASGSQFRTDSQQSCTWPIPFVGYVSATVVEAAGAVGSVAPQAEFRCSTEMPNSAGR